MRVIVMIALLALLTSNSAQAQVKVGVGSQSCGTWVLAQAPEKEYLMKGMMTSWVQGYLLGGLMATASERDIVGAKFAAFMPDHDAVQVWMTKYCQEHPLDMIQKGATRLLEEVIERAELAVARK